MKFLALGYILAVVTLAGGTMGYFYQAGLFDAILYVNNGGQGDPAHLERILTPVPADEYRQRTWRGWWIGCAVGATAGLLVVVKLNSERE